jgi:hypothetical protein
MPSLIITTGQNAAVSYKLDRHPLVGGREANRDGNDRISGGTVEYDYVCGNAGNDTLVGNDGVYDEIYGDGGRDTAICHDDDFQHSIETRLE